MVLTCCICGNNNKTNLNVTFHRLPTDETKLDLIFFLFKSSLNEIDKNSSVICSLHAEYNLYQIANNDLGSPIKISILGEKVEDSGEERKLFSVSTDKEQIILNEKKKTKRKVKSSKFKCTACDKIFNWRANLRKHYHTVHMTNKPYTCQICSKSFSRKDSLELHAFVHIEQCKSTCEHCGKSFKTKLSLEWHVKTHLNDEEYSCSICKRVFPLKVQLERHATLDNDCKELKECAETIEEVNSLDVNPKENIEPISCDICGQTFTNNDFLEKHALVHHEEEPFKCTFCGKTFTKLLTLKGHINLHGNLKCKLCNKTFLTKFRLRMHLMNHQVHKKRIPVKERRFKCDVCAKAFFYKAVLVQHMRIHTGEKPFTCSECGKSFPVKQTMQEHKRTHANKRPYLCDICGRSYVTRHSYNSHKRKCHNTSSKDTFLIRHRSTKMVAKLGRTAME